MDAHASRTPRRHRKSSRDGAILLDVREDDECRRAGRPAAIHVPLAECPTGSTRSADRTIVVCVCRSGGRSMRAADVPAENGFAAVNIEGGMIAWARKANP